MTSHPAPTIGNECAKPLRQRMADRPESTVDTAALLAAIIESTEDAIFSTDPSGVFRSWNRGAEQLYGYSAAEAVGQTDHLIIPPDLIAHADQVRERVLQGHAVASRESVRRKKDGTSIDVSFTASPIRVADGSLA